MKTMRMEREDIENSLKVLSHIVDDDFIITVDEARKIIGIDGETIEALQAKVEWLQAQLPKRGEIVRCGECIWYDPLDRTKPFFCCPVMDCVTGVMEDDFCSRGERRANMEVQE